MNRDELKRRIVKLMLKSMIEPEDEVALGYIDDVQSLVQQSDLLESDVEDYSSIAHDRFMKMVGRLDEEDAKQARYVFISRVLREARKYGEGG